MQIPKFDFSKLNNMKKGFTHGEASPICDKIVFDKVVKFINLNFPATQYYWIFIPNHGFAT